MTERGDPGRQRFRVPPLLLLIGLLGLSSCSIPRWPVEGPITSPFGVRWRGILPEIHRGVDISVGVGTEVHAMAGGRVRYSGQMPGYGFVVWIDHPGQVLTVYAHLSELRVEKDQTVGGGEVIGLSGSSGTATGAHLHFEIWRWGREEDPVFLLGGRPGRLSP